MTEETQFMYTTQWLEEKLAADKEQQEKEEQQRADEQAREAIRVGQVLSPL